MLTSDQQRALAWDRHVSVTANAGTGKTTVLVERYLALLHSGAVLPSGILVLTFTEKAAGELKRRVADRLTSDAAAVRDTGPAEQLKAVRRDFARAFIGTIHAFCAHIIREFPVEAGVDAGFSVLEGLDQRLMLGDAVHETLRHRMRAQGSDLRMLLQDLLHEKGRAGLYRVLTALVERRAAMERLTGPGGLYNQGERAILSSWHDGLTGQLDGLLRDPFLLESIERLSESATGPAAARVSGGLSVLRKPGDLPGRASAYDTIASAMVRKDGRLSAGFRNKGKDSGLSLWETAFLTRHRAINPLLPVILLPREANAMHRALLRSTRLLLDLGQESVERYEQRKLETARLDFEDLQLRAKYLLKNASVRRRLAERYRFIMVDEYQDTNLLQYEILLPLVNGLREGNLFIVGDPKQSIYAFRGADVTVFDRTRADILGADGTDILLAQSFRPLRDLAAFTNLVLGRAMTGDEFDVTYDAIVQARRNDAHGRVELLLSDSGEADGVSEGEAIARRIMMLRDEKEVVFDRAEQPRAARFADIGILVRSRAALPEIEGALVRHRIPYAVTAGTGFFQTQEVADVYSYLRFLISPSDDVALVTLLRSPFFAVSDADLFSVIHERPPGDLWSFLSATPRELGRSLPMKQAVQMLREDRRALPRMPLHEAIARLLDRTHYAAKHAGTSWGDQSVANLFKLQEIARAFERQGFVGLHDFVVRLRSLMEEEENEGQATADITRDAVQIMTVHAAKGQEYPIVFLPRLRAAVQSDREPFIDPYWGVGLVPPGMDEFEAEEPPLTGLLRARSRMRALAEEKRIFYVACTRARDMLVLSTDGMETGGRETPMTWIASAFGPGDGEPPPVLEQSVRTGILTAQRSGMGVVEVEHLLRVPVVRGGNLPEAAVEGAEAPEIPESREVALALHPLTSAPRGETYDLEEIAVCAVCPHLYRRIFVLNLFPHEEQQRRDQALRCRRDVRKTALWRASSSARERMDRVPVLAPLKDVLLKVTAERLFARTGGQRHAIFVPELPPGLSDEAALRLGKVSLAVAGAALSRLPGYEESRVHLFYPGPMGRCLHLAAAAAQVQQEGEEIVRDTLQTLRAGPFHHPAVPCPVCAHRPAVRE